LGGRGRWISEFKASLVCRVSSRTARAKQKNPVSKRKKKKKKVTHIISPRLFSLSVQDSSTATVPGNLDAVRPSDWQERSVSLGPELPR
jgi:hypothetical protein